MPVQGIYAQQHVNFPAFADNTEIRISREYPLGPAHFIIYNTNEHDVVIGAGSCPLHTAHPPYATMLIPNDTDFTVQNLSNHAILVEYPDD